MSVCSGAGDPDCSGFTGLCKNQDISPVRRSEEETGHRSGARQQSSGHVLWWTHQVRKQHGQNRTPDLLPLASQLCYIWYLWVLFFYLLVLVQFLGSCIWTLGLVIHFLVPLVVTLDKTLNPEPLAPDILLDLMLEQRLKRLVMIYLLTRLIPSLLAFLSGLKFPPSVSQIQHLQDWDF